jgi:hypothetical protein
MSTSSIVENFFLTSPAFREARWATKVVPHAPWGYIGEVAAYGAGNSQLSDSNYMKETLAELLKKKYDARKVDEAVSKGWELAKPYRTGNPGKMQLYDTYRGVSYAEKLLANPGWEGGLYDLPPIPVTLEDKHRSGTYTQADTDKLERIKTRELQDGLVKDHGLEGLFGGLHRRRKTKKSKRGGKKRKTTRKH